MKGFNDFIDKTPIWRVYFVMTVLTYLTSLLAFRVLLLDTFFTGYMIIRMSVIMSIGLSWWPTLMVVILRKSNKFWAAAEAFKAKVDAATTKADIDALKDDYTNLRSLASVPGHWVKINSIDLIKETKYPYLP